MTIRVALVDDEPLIRKGLAAVIGSEPDLLVVGEAGDGAEVPALVARTAPDVVLMDVRMPGLDGLEVTRRVRRLEAGLPGAPRLRIVALSANVLSEDRAAARAAGLDGFLSKPVELDRLRALVTEERDALAAAS